LLAYHFLFVSVCLSVMIVCYTRADGVADDPVKDVIFEQPYN